jgi:hypothetical protein
VSDLTTTQKAAAMAALIEERFPTCASCLHRDYRETCVCVEDCGLWRECVAAVANARFAEHSSDDR